MPKCELSIQNRVGGRVGEGGEREGVKEEESRRRLVHIKRRYKFYFNFFGFVLGEKKQRKQITSLSMEPT